MPKVRCAFQTLFLRFLLLSTLIFVFYRFECLDSFETLLSKVGSPGRALSCLFSKMGWTWGAPFFVLLGQFLDLVISAMDPMPVGGGVAPSSPGPSQPVPPIPAPEGASSSDEERYLSSKESGGSGSSYSEEDSLKVHHGSADGRTDGSPETPPLLMEKPDESSSDSPPPNRMTFIRSQNEVNHWYGEIERAMNDSMTEIDPKGSIGKIPKEELYEAVRINKEFMIKEEMEEICKSLRAPWPSREDADRTSIYHRLWELLDKHRRPEL